MKATCLRSALLGVEPSVDWSALFGSSRSCTYSYRKTWSFAREKVFGLPASDLESACSSLVALLGVPVVLGATGLQSVVPLSSMPGFLCALELRAPTSLGVLVSLGVPDSLYVLASVPEPASHLGLAFCWTVCLVRKTEHFSAMQPAALLSLPRGSGLRWRFFPQSADLSLRVGPFESLTRRTRNSLIRLNQQTWMSKITLASNVAIWASQLVATT